MAGTKTKPKKRVRKKAGLFGLRQTTEARLLGVSLKTASLLRGGTEPSGPVQRRLTELERLLHALAEVVDENVIPKWLETPNQALGGLKPLEVIERGEADRIWQMVFALRSAEPT